VIKAGWCVSVAALALGMMEQKHWWATGGGPAGFCRCCVQAYAGAACRLLPVLRAGSGRCCVQALAGAARRLLLRLLAGLCW